MRLREFRIGVFYFWLLGSYLVASFSYGADEVPNTDSDSSKWMADIIRSKSETRIDNLILTNKKVQVSLLKDGEKFRPSVEIFFEFKSPGWKLFVQGVHPAIHVANNLKYKISVYLNGRVNEVLLVAKGPNGAVQSEKFFIFSSKAQELSIVSPLEAIKVSAGSSYLSYKQSNYDRFESWSGIISVTVQSDERDRTFGFYSNLNLTALTVTSNQENYGPQIGHGILAGSYFFPENYESRWRHQMQMGIEYLTLLSNGSPFGFSNLIFPSIGYGARNVVDSKLDYFYKINFAPLKSSFDLSQKYLEIAVYRCLILENFHRGEIGIRYSNLTYSTRAGDIPVNMTTVSFLIGYTL